MSTEIRRGTARFTEREPGRATRHAFSFGSVYDPAHVRFGPMICHDEHLLGDGHGFDTHRHVGLDIVTWVVSGALTHRDATEAAGGSHTLLPGEVGHLHAGAGVDHSEIAVAPQTRFVQVWLQSSQDGEPSYAVRTVDPGPLSLALSVGDSTLWVSRLDAGESVTLPSAERVHVYVTSGALARHALVEPLRAGDALLATGEPGPLVLTAAVATQMLIWGLSAADQTT